jgi:DNA-binding transcriptional ArsR family regulator
MRTATPLLLPIFRSAGQARLLARLFLPNGEGAPLSKLATDAGLAKSRVSDELNRLEQAGLVESERVGNARVVRPNVDSPYYPELRSLILKAFGPVSVLTKRLREVEGVDEAFLYGSWASRYLGHEGPPPGDVDVLVVGSPDVHRVRGAARDAARELGREVNSTVLSRDEWDDEATGFVRTVRDRPLVRLDLGS